MRDTKYRYHEDHTLPKNNEIFVFGSNLGGIHGTGAAKVAKEKFGAIQGRGRGRQGNAYGIPTKGVYVHDKLEILRLHIIQVNIREFRDYVMRNKDLEFFVTRVGCGLAGFRDVNIAPLFKGSSVRCNFPISWKRYLE